MRMIIVDRLNIALGRHDIIKDVSFTVNRGEFLLIIGPNGSGKTTLLKGLSGNMTVQGGEIRIKGRGVNAYSRRELARIMAMVPQQTRVDLPFTVAETVLMGRSPHLGLVGIEGKRDHDIAALAMEFTDIIPLRHRRIDQISGGEAQRVIIARALCQQPEIILLDEPTAALDPAHQVKIMDLMDRMRREKNITVVMISHDLNLAAMYGDRILLLEHGKGVACDIPAKVMTRERLEAAYHCPVLVEKSSHTGTITVTPLPARFRK